MVYEYYGCLSRRIKEDAGKLRMGLEFEVVEAEKLNFFLGKEGIRKEDKERIISEKQEEVFGLFQEYGIAHEEFRKVKAGYLGDAGFRILAVYFENLEYVRYQYENWYLIRLSENKRELSGNTHDCSIYDWGGGDDVEINAYCILGMLPQEQGRILKGLYHPYILEMTNLQTNGNFSAIAAGTVFEGIRFYYVGAALCAALFDDRLTLTAFFDLGTRVATAPRLQSQYAAADSARTEILTSLGNVNPAAPITIFISHWHDDHCNALGRYEKLYGNLNNLANNTEWYVPASGLPVFTTVQNAVSAASFHVYPMYAAQAPVYVGGNPNIEVGKINLQNHPHAHHQGLYVKVTLRSGKSVLLVGDTTYEGIPQGIRTNGGAGYHCLQVCHHGGDYYLPPADQNLANATGYIPQAVTGANAVYSADGYRHGHPSAFFISDYHRKGYQAAYECYLHKEARSGHDHWDFL